MLNLILVTAEALRDLGSIPSGHLYARMMAHVTYGEYTAIIRTLRGAGLVDERHHELFWIGPKPTGDRS